MGTRTVKSVGIIGNGFVGNAISMAMDKRKIKTSIYDIREDKSTASLREAINCDIVFISVPAPTDVSSGRTDLRHIEKILDAFPSNADNFIVIKSTMLPGSCAKLHSRRSDLNLIFSPEFLTERTAVLDFEYPSRIILGFSREMVQPEKHPVHAFFKKCFPETYLISTDWKTAEFIKYFCNCFYAAKVSLMNEFYEVAKTQGLNWDACVEGLLSSKWVNRMHTQVPGPDGDFGFGGKCFPKDLLAFITFCKNNGINPLMLSSAWEKNIEVRTNKNWERIEGAFTKG